MMAHAPGAWCAVRGAHVIIEEAVMTCPSAARNDTKGATGIPILWLAPDRSRAHSGVGRVKRTLPLAVALGCLMAAPLPIGSTPTRAQGVAIVQLNVQVVGEGHLAATVTGRPRANDN